MPLLSVPCHAGFQSFGRPFGRVRIMVGAYNLGSRCLAKFVKPSDVCQKTSSGI